MMDERTAGWMEGGREGCVQVVIHLISVDNDEHLK